MPPKTAWRRSWRYVATQKAIRRDAVLGASPRRGGWEGDARDSWQGCTGFLTRMHMIRDKDARDSGQLLHFADFFVSLHCVRRRLHCHSSRTANGKLTTKKTERENDRGAHLPYLFLNVEPLKKKGKKKWKRKFGKLSCRCSSQYSPPSALPSALPAACRLIV